MNMPGLLGKGDPTHSVGREGVSGGKELICVKYIYKFEV